MRNRTSRSAKPVTQKRRDIANVNAIAAAARAAAAAHDREVTMQDVVRAHHTVMSSHKDKAVPGGRRRTRRYFERGGDMATLDPKTLEMAKRNLRTTGQNVAEELSSQPTSGPGSSAELKQQIASLRVTPPASRSSSPGPVSPGGRRRTRRTRRT